MALHVDHILTISELPRDCIADCSVRGDCLPTVEHWRAALSFTVNRDRAARCLHGYGAWDDLASVSDETIANRILWLACGDFSEFIVYAERAGVDPFNRPDSFDPSSGSDIFCLE